MVALRTICSHTNSVFAITQDECSITSQRSVKFLSSFRSFLNLFLGYNDYRYQSWQLFATSEWFTCNLLHLHSDHWVSGIASWALVIADYSDLRFFFPWFLLPAFAIGLVYWHLAFGYLNTSRDLRWMESNSRSPIFSEFGELLEGIVTVWVFSAKHCFLDDLHAKIDITTKASSVLLIPSCWILTVAYFRCGITSGWQTNGSCLILMHLVLWPSSLQCYSHCLVLSMQEQPPFVWLRPWHSLRAFTGLAGMD